MTRRTLRAGAEFEQVSSAGVHDAFECDFRLPNRQIDYRNNATVRLVQPHRHRRVRLLDLNPEILSLCQHDPVDVLHSATDFSLNRLI